jgi:hypothetical protein
MSLTSWLTRRWPRVLGLQELADGVLPGPLPIRPANRAIIAAMDITKMLADLRTERENIEQAIIVLERIGRGQGERRGRPPKWITITHLKKVG